jgi:hypothetical protein
MHLSDQKILRGYTRTTVLKEWEGKAKGRVGLEGMEGISNGKERKIKGKERRIGEEREGTEDSEGWCSLN